jgi:ABC-type transporter Mla subunit MlaD
LYKKSLRDQKAAVPLDIGEIIEQLEQNLHQDQIDKINSTLE